MYFGVNFLSNEKGLISFAIISAEWDNNRDYLDMIIPFVLNSINAHKQTGIVSLIETKERLKEEFGISILSNLLELIFKRLTNEEYAYLKLEKSTFYLTGKEIKTEQFEKDRLTARENQQRVLKELFRFLDSNDVEYNKTEIESDLIKYLSKYGYKVLESTDFMYEDPLNIVNFRIGRFIEYIYHNDEVVFEYVKEIVKGAMLASTIHVQNGKKLRLNKKFNGTEVYFDTSLLFYALGYSGKAQEVAIKELINVLQEAEAKVCYFSHTLEEVNGILDAYISLYKNNSLYRSYNYDYLIQEKVTDVQALQYKAMLRTNLDRLGLVYKETLSFDSEEVKKVDWLGFEKYLNEHMIYNKETSRDNDIKSIVSMYMIRKRDDYLRIESCDAIFVTTNLSLVQHTNNYFKEHEKRKDYQAIIDDTLLTSIVWIKCAKCSDELPTMKLISDALASQIPNKKFWEEFLKTVDEYKDKDIISEDNANELKYEAFCKRNIYNASDGDYRKVTHGTILETLELNERLKHKELVNKLEVTNEAKNKYKDMAIQEAGNKCLRVKSIADIFLIISKTWWIISAIGLYFLSEFITSILGVEKASNIIITLTTSIVPFLAFMVMILEKVLDRNINIIESYFIKKAISSYEPYIKEYIDSNYSELNEEIFEYCIINKFKGYEKFNINNA